MKVFKFTILLAILLSFAMIPLAFAQITGVTDLDQTDLNTINSQGQAGVAYVLNETYGEDGLTPYPSHGGSAVVNDAGKFFEMEMTVDAAGNYMMSIDLINASPYTWSDYHFIFDEDIEVTFYATNAFDNSSYENHEVSFWTPGEIPAGQNFRFTFEFTVNAAGTYTLTQLATTEAGAAAVPAVGLIGGISMVVILTVIGSVYRQEWRRKQA
jgi:hypothetical protein